MYVYLYMYIFFNIYTYLSLDICSYTYLHNYRYNSWNLFVPKYLFTGVVVASFLHIGFVEISSFHPTWGPQKKRSSHR